jgi:hypothetical protein
VLRNRCLGSPFHMTPFLKEGSLAYVVGLLPWCTFRIEVFWRSLLWRCCLYFPGFGRVLIQMSFIFASLIAKPHSDLCNCKVGINILKYIPLPYAPKYGGCATLCICGYYELPVHGAILWTAHVCVRRRTVSRDTISIYLAPFVLRCV